MGAGGPDLRPPSSASTVNGRASPFRAETWRCDIQWPVRHSGTAAAENCDNISLEADLSLTRSTLRSAQNIGRTGVGDALSLDVGERGSSPLALSYATQGSHRHSFMNATTNSENSVASDATIADTGTINKSCCGAYLPSRTSSHKARCASARLRHKLRVAPVAGATKHNLELLEKTMADHKAMDSMRYKAAKGKTVSARKVAPGLPTTARSCSGAPHACVQTPNITDLQAASERATLVRQSFLRTREQIEARLEVLDRSSYGDAHRRAVFIERTGLPDESSEVGKLLQLYRETGLKSLPPVGHPANLESWPSREGGCSRTSELLTAFEVLNFHRWLCGLPRVRLDSFQQELADFVLRVLTQKDARSRLSSGASEHLNRFAEALREYLDRIGKTVLVVSHLPGVPDAVRAAFAAGTSSGGSLSTGRSIYNQNLVTPADEEALQQFSALLHIGRTGNLEPSKTPRTANGLYTVDRRLSPLSPRSARGGGRGRPGGHVQRVRCVPMDDDAMDDNGAAPTSGSRKTAAWGDPAGRLAMRRLMLDPRLRSVGLMRRGCRTCLWAAPSCEGEPPRAAAIQAPQHTFLDPEAIEQVVTRKNMMEASAPMMALMRWREDVRKRISAPPQGISSFDSDQDSKPPSPRRNLQEWEGNSQNADNTVPSVEQQEDLVSVLDCSEADNNEQTSPPLFVCFPPAGIVPVDEVDVVGIPWTISPDPGRFCPTAQCRVHIFRVTIDVEAGRAHRLSDAEIPLSSFCVDCSDVGTAFCVVFTLAVDPQPGEQFEVVLSGLAGRGNQTEGVPNIVYFLSLESFRSCHQDLAPLHKRAAAFSMTLGAEHLWAEPIWYFPGIELPTTASPQTQVRNDQMPQCKRRPAQDPFGTLRAQAQKGHSRHSTLHFLSPTISNSFQFNEIYLGNFEESRRAPTPQRTRQRRRQASSQRDLAARQPWTAKNAPPFGVAPHPNCTERTIGGTFELDVYDQNEPVIALSVPREIVIRATLLGFMKSQAKWETIPHATLVMCFNEPNSGTQPQTQADSDKSGEKPEGTHPRMRVVVRMLLPSAGRYELRLHWGYMVEDAWQCRALNTISTPNDHPVRIHINASSKACEVRNISPSISQGGLKRFGYPMKHQLAEQFGLTLVGPMRYRLRIGDVRFTVHVRKITLPKQSTAAPALLPYRRPTSRAESSCASDRTRACSPGDPNLKNEDLYSLASMTGTPHLLDSEYDFQAASCAKNNKSLILTSFQHEVRTLLSGQTRRATEGELCIAAVLGVWRRVEVLHRRQLPPVHRNQGHQDADGGLGGNPATHGFEVEEVHEAVVRITDEDQNQPVQLLVFGVGAAGALDLPNVQNRASAETPAWVNGVPKTGNSCPMGCTEAPSRWCLAEYFVSGAHPLPYDEDEMEKPIPTPNPMEAMGFDVVEG